MDLHTVHSVVRPSALEGVAWGPGHAWLAGGTWLFSEPQPGTTTLVDLEGLGWAALEAGDGGLTIGATCRIAELAGFAGRVEWRAMPAFRFCCESFLASFKVWNAATVGGNVVMALPAGPMIALTAGLDGVCTVWPREGGARTMMVEAFVTGNHVTALGEGELLRSIHLPVSALRARVAMRHGSLTKGGRSAALLVGAVREDGGVSITVTGATDRPVVLRFAGVPDAGGLRRALDGIAATRWFADVHGSAGYKRHLACYFAESIRRELEG